MRMHILNKTDTPAKKKKKENKKEKQKSKEKNKKRKKDGCLYAYLMTTLGLLQGAELHNLRMKQ